MLSDRESVALAGDGNDFRMLIDDANRFGDAVLANRGRELLDACVLDRQRDVDVGLPFFGFSLARYTNILRAKARFAGERWYG